MKIFNVGIDELDADSLKELGDKFEWIVYWYEGGSYDGYGDAVCLGKDGLLYLANLGHCSCWAPEETLPGMSKWTVEEFLRPKDSIFDLDIREEVEKKVIELLS